MTDANATPVCSDDEESGVNGQETDAQSVGLQETTSGIVPDAGADAATHGTAAALGSAAIVQAPEAQTLQVAPSEEEVGQGQTVLPNEDATETTVSAETSAVMAGQEAAVDAAEGEAEELPEGPNLVVLLEEATKIMEMIRDSDKYPKVSEIVEAFKEMAKHFDAVEGLGPICQAMTWMAEEAEESRASRGRAKDEASVFKKRAANLEKQVESMTDAYQTKCSEVERMIKEAKAEAEAEANSLKKSLLKSEQDLLKSGKDHEWTKDLMRALEKNAEAIEEEKSHLKLQIDSLREELKDIRKEQDVAGVNYSQLMEERQRLAKKLGEAKKAWQEKVEARPRR
jgi:chromosome segregation ATPase